MSKTKMSPFKLVSAFALFALNTACMAQVGNVQRSAAVPDVPSVVRHPVLVELFTSEGCSSCPPADRALKFLADQQPVQGVEIVPLAFHVDYWDHQGWKDPFSSSAYTKRQELYVNRFGIDSSYTPQMVVDGASEFIGSDLNRAAKEIGKALSRQKGVVSLAVNGNTISISISALPKHSSATAFLAIVEDDLTTVVDGGENRGSTLQDPAVVRELRPLGLIDPDQATATFNVETGLQSSFNAENIRFIGFVQENDKRRIIAVSNNSVKP